MSATVEARLDALLKDKMERRAAKEERPTPTLAEIEAGLNTFLASRVEGDFTVSEVGQLSGGAANAQYVFRLAWTRDGEQRDEKMVLRRKAPAAIVQSDIEREGQIQQVAHGIIPAPEVFWATGDRSDFGEPALIAGFVPGVPAPTKDVPKATGLGTAYGPRLRELIAPAFIQSLARLHAYDWSGDDLSLYEKPEAGTTEAIEKRLAWWDRVWEEDRLEVHPTVLLTQQWLWDRKPVCDHVSLVHGDYRNGNFLFDEESGELTAILDWELGYLGDRHQDLAYAMLPGWGHPDENGAYLCAGLREKEAFIAEYEQASGLSVDRERLDYYTVLNFYWAVVALYGTGPRVAVERQTSLEVMMNFLAGLGGFFISELNRILKED